MNATTKPVIRLYTQTLNPYSEKIAAGLALKHLEFERVVSEDPEDVKRWSPIARTLPVLEIDGRRRADSTEILAWLEELYPEPALVAFDPKVADAQRHLAEWSDSSFTWYWNQWRAARYPQPGDDAPVDAGLLSRLMEHVGRPFGRAPSSRAEARELEIINKLEDRFEDLVGFLRERPFFHSDEPSIADISVYAMLHVLEDGPIPDCGRAIAERPTLVAYINRMNDRIASVERRDIDADLAVHETPDT
jgi:glutathione S-transferase